MHWIWIFRSVLNDERFALLINVVDKMLEPDFVSFEEYIKMRNDFRWRIV